MTLSSTCRIAQAAIFAVALLLSLTLVQAQNSDMDYKGAFFETEVSVEVAQGDQGTVIKWDYVNLIDEPMIVDRIEGLDDDLDAKDLHLMNADWRSSGTIKAVFTPGKKSGLFRKTIFVHFTNCPIPVKLVLEAKVLKEGETPSMHMEAMAWDPVAAVESCLSK